MAERWQWGDGAQSQRPLMAHLAPLQKEEEFGGEQPRVLSKYYVEHPNVSHPLNIPFKTKEVTLILECT